MTADAATASPKSDAPQPANNSARRSPIHHTIASQTAGFVSTFAFYPLDVLKMRFMSQDGTKERQHNNSTYSSIVRSTRTIYQEEGLRALYRGVHVAILGSVAAWGTYMYLYRSMLHFAATWGLVDVENKHGGGGDAAFHARAFASALASAAAAMASNPVWLIKTRMQLEEVHVVRGCLGTAMPVQQQTYRGFLHSGLHIVRTGGWRSLWVGSSAQVLLGVPNSLNFPIYESIKSFRLRQTGRQSLDVADVCACTTITKTILAVISHPIFVIKTRLQDQRSNIGEVRYTSLVQALRTTLKREGPRGLYRGVAPALAQSIPRSVTQFLVYEACLHWQWW